MKKLQRNSTGFTIIEVLIVLAIAGLIMLIVFLAVPALQRNSRNNARNNDASRISSAITECLANRNGEKDSCNEGSDLQVGSLSQLSIPAGEFSDGAATSPGEGTETSVDIGFQRTCNTAGDDDEEGGIREFVVRWQNEEGIPRCLGS